MVLLKLTRTKTSNGLKKNNKLMNAPKDPLQEATDKVGQDIQDSFNAEIDKEIAETNSVPMLKMAKTPLTLFCHDGNINMNSEGTFKIDHEGCMQQAEWSYDQGKFMPGIEAYLEIFKYKPDEILTIKNPTTQHKKIVGLIELTVGVCRMSKKHGKNIPIFFECPETYLHPAKQACVTQFIVQVMNEFGALTPKAPEEVSPL